jgi:hypothetical protein
VFSALDSFRRGGLGSLDTRGIVMVTLVGLRMFGTTFLGTVLAVFLILGAVRGDPGLVAGLAMVWFARRDL